MVTAHLIYFARVITILAQWYCTERNVLDPLLCKTILGYYFAWIALCMEHCPGWWHLVFPGSDISVWQVCMRLRDISAVDRSNDPPNSSSSRTLLYRLKRCADVSDLIYPCHNHDKAPRRLPKEWRWSQLGEYSFSRSPVHGSTYFGQSSIVQQRYLRTRSGCVAGH